MVCHVIILVGAAVCCHVSPYGTNQSIDQSVIKINVVWLLSLHMLSRNSSPVLVLSAVFVCG